MSIHSSFLCYRREISPHHHLHDNGVVRSRNADIDRTEAHITIKRSTCKRAREKKLGCGCRSSWRGSRRRHSRQSALYAACSRRVEHRRITAVLLAAVFSRYARNKRRENATGNALSSSSRTGQDLLPSTHRSPHQATPPKPAYYSHRRSQPPPCAPGIQTQAQGRLRARCPLRCTKCGLCHCKGDTTKKPTGHNPPRQRPLSFLSFLPAPPRDALATPTARAGRLRQRRRRSPARCQRGCDGAAARDRTGAPAAPLTHNHTYAQFLAPYFPAALVSRPCHCFSFLGCSPLSRPLLLLCLLCPVLLLSGLSKQPAVHSNTRLLWPSS